MSLGFFFVLTLFFLIFKHYFKSTSSPKRPPLPPGPKPWPIVGNILQMGTKPHISMTQFAKLHGPLISLRLGTQLLVIGSSPEAAAEILRTHDRLLSARYILKIMFAGGVDLNRVSLMWALQCNERWKVLRSLCKAELFSPKAIESQTLLREKKMVEMVEFLGSREGQVVKVKQVVSATAFN
ncbi:Cytochrome P, partial [Trema orientale]